MIRVYIRKLGVAWAVVALTVASIILSVIITSGAYLLSGRAVTGYSLAVASLVPAIIAPLFSWLQFSALHKLDIAERRLVELSSRDELTGAFNRRYILGVAESEHLRARRSGHAFSVAILDVDSFKSINDTYGHPAGDLVLREFAALCRRHARITDYFARYDGDEFMFVLPETDQPEAMDFAERLREAIAAASVAYRGEAIRVTASIGVAAALRDESIDELLARADSALYEAKDKGKNALVPA